MEQDGSLREIKSISICLNGIPDHLYTFIIKRFPEIMVADNLDCQLLRDSEPIKPDPNFFGINLIVNSRLVGHITAEVRPQSHTQITLDCPLQNWPSLEPCWESLYQLLDENGWVEHASELADLPSYLPRTKRGLNIWKQYWIAMKDAQRQLLEIYKDSYRTKRNIPLREIQDFLAHNSGITLGEKTLSLVRKAGSEGYLD